MLPVISITEMILTLALAWGMLSRMPDSRWVSITYFFGGLLVTILVAVQLTVPESWRGLLLFEETRMFRLMVMGVIGLTSRFTLSAAFICILGVAGFLAPSDGR